MTMISKAQQVVSDHFEGREQNDLKLRAAITYLDQNNTNVINTALFQTSSNIGSTLHKTSSDLSQSLNNLTSKIEQSSINIIRSSDELAISNNKNASTMNTLTMVIAGATVVQVILSIISIFTKNN